MNAARVVSIHAGAIKPLGPEGVPSAFVKSAVPGPVRITALGITGDEQADLSAHGGPEKAVYGYSRAHYADWRHEFPQHAMALVPGGFGENLCIEGLRETDICIGDVHRVGSCHLQVCQPRQPCFKLALHFGDKKMPKAMIRSGRAGWYYRVLLPGQTEAGDAVELTERPNPDFSFARLVELISHGDPTRQELERMRSMSELASGWRERATALLQRFPTSREAD